MKSQRQDDSSAALEEKASKGQHDKDELDDVRQSLQRVLHRLDKPENDSRTAKILNSAFMVTFLGGIFVALIGWGLQTITSLHEKETLEAKQARESKEKVAFDFASTFPVTLDLAQRFRSRALWLEEHRAKKVAAHYDDDRTFDETEKFCESLGDQYLARPPVASSYNQIIAVFTNQSVNLYATNLLSSFSAMVDTTNRAEIRVRFAECSRDYKTLTKFMFQEALQPK